MLTRRYLDPDDVTVDRVLAVIGGISSEDEIFRTREQLEAAVNTIVAVEWMAGDPDANREIIEAIVRDPSKFPAAHAILRKFADLAVEQTGNWLARARDVDRRQHEEDLAEQQADLAHKLGWKS